MTKKLINFLKHYFFPHQTNNYRAKTLHHDHLLFYIILLLFIQSFYTFFKKVNPDILGYATNIQIEEILELVNTERQKSGLTPLTRSGELDKAAVEKASDMFSKNYWAHISPTGTTPWEFITKSGYKYVYAGENLAKSFDNSRDVVEAWMKSPTHRANILKPEYSEIGIAVKDGILNKEETTLVVQEFGSRSQAMANAQKANIPELNKNTAPAEVLADTNPNSGWRITKSLSLMAAEFMLVVLLIDSIFIWRHKTVRISGHSLAHVMFFLALLGAMSATGIGAIL